MSNRLRVGIFLHKDYDPTVGGGFSHYSRVMKAIDEKSDWNGVEFVFIDVLKFKGQKKQYPFKRPVLTINPWEIDNRSHVKYKLLSKLSGIPSFKASRERVLVKISDLHKKLIEEELRKNRIDIIFYPTASANTWNYPFVVTHWDIGHYSIHPFPEIGMNDTFERRERYYEEDLKKAFAIFCESEAGKTELIRFKNINSNKIFVAPAFAGGVVDLKVPRETQDEILRRFELTANDFFFYPAQFWAHKNHYNLLLAFKIFSRNNSSARLLFTGSDKGNLAYIKDVISELGIQKRVIYAGFVEMEEIYTFYKNCIALVMPTFLGPTNLPLLEAATLNTPVIASALAGHKELLGDYAVYVEPSDPNSIANAMENVYLKKGPTQKYFNDHFTIESYLNSINLWFNALQPYRKAFGYNFEQY